MSVQTYCLFSLWCSEFVVLVQLRELVSASVFNCGQGFEVETLLFLEKRESLGVLGKTSLKAGLLHITNVAAAQIKAPAAAVLVGHFSEFVPAELFESVEVCRLTQVCLLHNTSHNCLSWITSQVVTYLSHFYVLKIFFYYN